MIFSALNEIGFTRTGGGSEGNLDNSMSTLFKCGVTMRYLELHKSLVGKKGNSNVHYIYINYKHTFQYLILLLSSMTYRMQNQDRHVKAASVGCM